MAATVFGVILGAFLKPLLDQWYERKKKTVKIMLDKPISLVTPHQDLKFQWQAHSFGELINSPIEIRNASGVTLRKFTIKFEAPAKPTEKNFGYFGITESDGCRIKDFQAENENWDLVIEHFERNGFIKANLLSDYARSISVHTMDDIELSVNIGGLNSKTEMFLRMLCISAVSTFAIAATLTLIGN
ncbi:hypothetical protein D7D48_04740 [Sphingorhabdus wooponensis]|uniref:Uncharacterized protein n=1 Tax=Sphingorhabdus wooponensis TaxID=940136 RepID=A0A3R8S5C1_9SPHN|nr:hypothetical protein D7D48_04740 [Sphingorhabdus wooponensis]